METMENECMSNIEDIEGYVELKAERDALADELESVKAKVEEMEGKEGKLNEDLNRLRKIIADNLVASKPAQEQKDKRDMGIRELIIEQYKEKIEG